MPAKTPAPKFEVGQYYRIYNRGNNSEKLFYQERNYEYFLKKYDYYLSGYLDTFAFVLMPNHFHFLVRCKPMTSAENLLGFKNLVSLKAIKGKTPNQDKRNDAISEKFRLLFMSYTKAVNKQEGRHGSLFEKVMKRKQITDNNYLRHIVCYIHRNPVHHDFVEDMRDWIFSSYNRMLSERATKLKKKEVLDWFDGKKNYLEFHKRIKDLSPIRGLVWD